MQVYKSRAHCAAEVRAVWPSIRVCPNSWRRHQPKLKAWRLLNNIPPSCKVQSPAKTRPLSLEAIPETDSIAPGRVLTLVRPGNDLVLRRIRNQTFAACRRVAATKRPPRYACNLPRSCVSARQACKKKRKEKQGSGKKASRKWVAFQGRLALQKRSYEANCKHI